MIVQELDAEVGFQADAEFEAGLLGELAKVQHRTDRTEGGRTDVVGTGRVQAVIHHVRSLEVEDLVRQVVSIDVEQFEAGDTA